MVGFINSRPQELKDYGTDVFGYFCFCDSYAIGGLAGGESKDSFWRVVAQCTAALPEDKPRYVMVQFPWEKGRKKKGGFCFLLTNYKSSVVSLGCWLST